MGPAKAALESSVRYLAGELGSKRMRVHALSPGPLKTRAAFPVSDAAAALTGTIAYIDAGYLIVG